MTCWFWHGFTYRTPEFGKYFPYNSYTVAECATMFLAIIICCRCLIKYIKYSWNADGCRKNCVTLLWIIASKFTHLLSHRLRILWHTIKRDALIDSLHQSNFIMNKSLACSFHPKKFYLLHSLAFWWQRRTKKNNARTCHERMYLPKKKSYSFRI